jgi:hypothetical protein
MKISGVKIIKLITGEELIGDISQSGDNVSVRGPATVHLVPGERGTMSVAMVPFAPYAEESAFMFNLQHIMTVYTPGVELLNQYSQRFGSGIVVANTLP